MRFITDQAPALPPPEPPPASAAHTTIHAPDLPPPEPPPVDNSLSFPPCSLFDNYMRSPTQPPIATIDLSPADDDNNAPPHPHTQIMDSVTHVICPLRVCGVKGDDPSSVKVLRLSNTADTLIDGGSNVCVTGNLLALLDVCDITPIHISVALDNVPLCQQPNHKTRAPPDCPRRWYYVLPNMLLLQKPG